MTTSAETMPALLLYGPKEAKYEERPIPELGEHDVLVRIAFVGVCGSDVSNFLRSFPISNRSDDLSSYLEIEARKQFS